MAQDSRNLTVLWTDIERVTAEMEHAVQQVVNSPQPPSGLLQALITDLQRLQRDCIQVRQVSQEKEEQNMAHLKAHQKQHQIGLTATQQQQQQQQHVGHPGQHIPLVPPQQRPPSHHHPQQHVQSGMAAHTLPPQQHHRHHQPPHQQQQQQQPPLQKASLVNPMVMGPAGSQSQPPVSVPHVSSGVQHQLAAQPPQSVAPVRLTPTAPVMNRPAAAGVVMPNTAYQQ